MADVTLWRALHVLGAVLLVGNVTVTGFWAAFLYARRDSVPFRPVAKAILWTDLVFTAGGAALLVVSGIQLVLARRLPFWDTPWLVQGVGALAVATLVWLALLLPDQVRMARLAGQDADALRRVYWRWTILGWGSTAVLVFALWRMVAK